MLFLFSLLSYLFGSISSAVLVCRLMGLPDPRTLGSKNPGATNVLRIGGKLPATLTLLGDVLKGIVPVMIAIFFFPSQHLVIAAAAFFAFLGHLYPVFFGFEGGKGIATFIGCLIAVSITAAIIFGAIFAMVLLITRYVSLSSLIATLLMPLVLYFFKMPLPIIISFTLMLPFIYWRHRSNIQRLYRGEEHRLQRIK